MNRSERNRKFYEGRVFKNNEGLEYEVLKYIKVSEVCIEFLESGYKRKVSLGHIKDGKIKDRLHKTYYGVGFLGCGKHTKGTSRKATQVWTNMLQRCYGHYGNHPTYKGCSVVEEWHNFQNFAKWFEENYIEGYQLDKDIKVEGNKVYGPDTCMFVSKKENTEAALCYKSALVSPSGEVVDIYNFRKTANELALDSSSIVKLIKGKLKTHKGYRLFIKPLKGLFTIGDNYLEVH